MKKIAILLTFLGFVPGQSRAAEEVLSAAGGVANAMVNAQVMHDAGKFAVDTTVAAGQMAASGAKSAYNYGKKKTQRARKAAANSRAGKAVVSAKRKIGKAAGKAKRKMKRLFGFGKSKK